MSQFTRFLVSILIALCSGAVLTLQAGETVARIQLKNQSDGPRTEEAVQIGLMELGIPQETWQWGVFEVKKDGHVIPSQTIDRDGDSLRDAILILPTLEAGETVDLEIIRRNQGEAVSVSPKRTQADLSIRVDGKWVEGKKIGNIERGNWEYVGGRWADVRHLKVPHEHSDHSNYIRYEGVGIESGLVGYRFYLDWRNGFDVFGKTTHHMVLKETGLDGFESYHEMQDWGMDILKVGDALGIGGYGFWDGEQVIRVSDTGGIDCRVLENGYLRSTLKLSYENWTFADHQIDLDAVLSITAGSRLVEVQLTPSEAMDGICTGIVKLEDTAKIEGSLDIPDEHWSYLATWGKQSLDGQNLGMAIVFRKDSLKQVTEDALNEVLVLQSNSGLYRYYFLAAWEGEKNGIKTQEAFRAYLEDTVDRLNSPISVDTGTPE